MDPTPQTKASTALFFAQHYGCFHAGYLLFLVVGAIEGDTSIDIWFAACVVAFAVNYAFSWRYNIEADRRGTPNIGTLMFTPYIRIVPMHLAIIFGAALADSTLTLVLFGLLKTAADCGMHLAEHRQLRKSRTRRLPG